MTFKDLQKLVQSQASLEQNQLVTRLKDKPFWIWNIEQHKQEDIKTKGDCCFNHIIGLPRKDRIEKSIFDYEKLLYDSLLIPDFYNASKHNFKHKHLWVKKVTGLGVTEFMLRLMAWLCLRNNDYRNSQMCIVIRPNQDTVIKLIKRMMKGLFEHKLGITFANKDRKERSASKPQVIHFDSIFHIYEKQYYIVFLLPVIFLQSLLQHFL